jgi:hypothetical protein
VSKEHRLRARVAAHAHRKIGEAAFAGQVLAEAGGKGIAREWWARCALPTLRNAAIDFVMPGLVAGIHVFTVSFHKKTWMAG